MHGHTAWDLAATDAMKKALKTPIVSSFDTVTSEVRNLLILPQLWKNLDTSWKSINIFSLLFSFHNKKD